MPNYKKAIRIGWLFSLPKNAHAILDTVVHIRKRLSLYLTKVPVLVRFAVLGFLIFALVYTLIFIIPKRVDFTYAEKTCLPQLVLAPSAHRPVGDTPYAVEFEHIVRIGPVELLSTGVCFIPKDSPKPGSQTMAISPFGGWIFARQFTVTVPETPGVQADSVLSKEVSATKPLQLPLESPDTIHQYKLRIEDKVVDCPTKEAKLHCSLDILDLTQGGQYSVSLERYYQDKLSEVVSKHTMKTLLPIGFVEGTVTNDQLVYDNPASFTFRFDRPLSKAEVKLELAAGDAKQAIKTEASVQDDLLTVALPEPLARKAQFTLQLTHVEGKDGSSLNEPMNIAFQTRGGPEVTRAGVGAYGIAQAGTIILTLDQSVANLDALPGLVTVEGAAVRVTQSGTSLVLNYSGAGFCQPLTIRVKPGLKNQHGVAQDAGWSLATRTICHTTRSIGQSVQGRAILAYTYGSGSKTKLYVGALHGNEHSSRYLLDAWRSDLEAQAPNIPADTRVIVVPSANPDGVAANTRTNARNVDLNRNFNTSDWKTDVQTVNAQPFPGGGGASAESEPETRALVAFSREVAPQFTMSFHSAAAYVIGNGCGGASSIAARYAQLTGYRNMTGNSGAFAYEITGTYDDWLCERLGRTSVLVELVSNNSQEFPRNKTALWETVRQ